jgi:hypothetical protein
MAVWALLYVLYRYTTHAALRPIPLYVPYRYTAHVPLYVLYRSTTHTALRPIPLYDPYRYTTFTLLKPDTIFDMTPHLAASYTRMFESLQGA